MSITGIRQAKRKCWENFLTGAEEGEPQGKAEAGTVLESVAVHDPEGHMHNACPKGAAESSSGDHRREGSHGQRGGFSPEASLGGTAFAAKW
jgi:hypothetical protein